MEMQKTKGVVLILLSAGCYSTMMCMLKLIAHINPVLTAFLRFLFGLTIFVGIIGLGRIRLRFANKPLLLIRGVLGGLAIYMSYLTVIQLGVAKGTVIIFSYPVFGTLFGAWLLREKLGVFNFLALGLAMAGLFLLVTTTDNLNTFASIGKYEWIGITAALTSGLVVAIIRKLHRTDGSFEIFFSHCLIGGVILFLPAMKSFLPFSLRDWLILAAVGLFATGGQLSMTQGYRYLPVKTASLLSMSELVLNCTAGIVLFHEPATLRAGIGAVMIISACMIVLVMREKNLQPAARQETIDAKAICESGRKLA